MSDNKPCVGDKVFIKIPHGTNLDWVEAVVDAPLSVQFTVTDTDDKVYYYFYADRGDTWLARES